ncbi:disulfide-isomerase A3-like [Homarus americanus]|uniref:protein disulfide-isomerase n=1 Tax=Homarus americanus TaxID=6706 RepID=A0A8J5MY16_HOMAM|nr:disulfide-isomerase A3-like [Homarus americanus]
MAPRLLILFTLVAAAFADDVLQLGDADFDTKVGSYDTVLVMFYAPWCGHCKRLKPEFEKAATSLKTNDPLVILAKVDCTEDGKDTCGKYGVSGYPTLKIFRGGDLSSDYNGPREANGIVKYMRSQVGPASKELNSIEVAEAFLSAPEVSVLFFGDDSKLKDAFLKAADKLRETVRFGHSVKAEINEKYGYDNVVVLIRPKHLENKFEETSVVYEGPNDKSAIETFVKDNFHGLVGHRTQDSAQDFGSPLVVAYYNVDYVKNVKGTNYWRNRVLKVRMETFEAFLTKLKAGELEPYVKSEPIPDQDGPVAVAVAKNFDELVTNSDKDVMIEFYAPWCGHCKKLAPTYEELGTAMKDEAVEIVKMDATANDVPSSFNVRGFPTLFWKPKGGEPVPYNGGRELDDFIPYIAKEASSELNGWDRKGNPKKTEL